MELINARDITDSNALMETWNDISLFESTAEEWDKIAWADSYEKVQRLRYRIYIKTQGVIKDPSKENLRRLTFLQEKMLFSYDNLLVAVRRVTQINKGRNTPGLDTFLLNGKEQRMRLVKLIRYKINLLKWKPSPVKRTYIPKKNGKLRPLGIPTLVDRVLQAIVKNALEPEWEAKADVGSYGFRPGRSCADAIEKIFKTLGKSTTEMPRKQWVLDADIKGCFDNISHQYLVEKLDNFPALEIIERWLKAGYVHKNTFHETDTGTPQGGIISPLLANIALDGIEKELGIRYRLRKSSKGTTRLVLEDYIPKNASKTVLRRSYIRYADDFVILSESKDDCENCRELLNEILKTRGLKISEEKTKIRHITEGFDFLGCTIKCYSCNINIPGNRGNKFSGYKILVTPSKSSLKKYKEKLKIIFNECRGHEVDALIYKLNPIIRGWSNYFKPYSSRKSFEYMDAYLYWKQLRYGIRLHPNKGKQWVVDKYFSNYNKFRPKDKWVFGSGEKSFAIKHRWFSIKRHSIIPNGYSPDNPELKEFWLTRKTLGINSNILGAGENKIASKQKHTCPICFQTLYNGESIEKHHIIAKKEGGKDSYSNLVWLHKVCHQSMTSNKVGREVLIRNLEQIRHQKRNLKKTDYSKESK